MLLSLQWPSTSFNYTKRMASKISSSELQHNLMLHSFVCLFASLLLYLCLFLDLFNEYYYDILTYMICIYTYSLRELTTINQEPKPNLSSAWAACSIAWAMALDKNGRVSTIQTMRSQCGPRIRNPHVPDVCHMPLVSHRTDPTRIKKGFITRA